MILRRVTFLNILLNSSKWLFCFVLFQLGLCCHLFSCFRALGVWIVPIVVNWRLTKQRRVNFYSLWSVTSFTKWFIKGKDDQCVSHFAYQGTLSEKSVVKNTLKWLKGTVIALPNVTKKFVNGVVFFGFGLSILWFREAPFWNVLVLYGIAHIASDPPPLCQTEKCGRKSAPKGGLPLCLIGIWMGPLIILGAQCRLENW